ncbi:MAG: CHRD domain-containing protein, partial [Gemmatimonadales bacterium]
VYTAQLNGANEAPTPVTTTATGHAVVTVLGNLVSWKVDVDTPIDSVIAGHIHRHHPDSVAGNVRVDFQIPAGGGLDFTGTLTVGSQAAVHDSILALMRAGRSYVNIHTRVNGGGEIRGTLVKQ